MESAHHGVCEALCNLLNVTTESSGISFRRCSLFRVFISFKPQLPQAVSTLRAPTRHDAPRPRGLALTHLKPGPQLSVSVIFSHQGALSYSSDDASEYRQNQSQS